MQHVSFKVIDRFRNFCANVPIVVFKKHVVGKFKSWKLNGNGKPY